MLNFIVNFLKKSFSGDGNCLYYSFSINLFGTEHYGDLLRALSLYILLDYQFLWESLLRSGSIEKEPILVDADIRTEYVKILKDAFTLHSWGDINAVQAISILVQRPIFLYCTCKNTRNHWLLQHQLAVQDYEAVKTAFADQMDGLPAFLIASAPGIGDFRIPLMAYFEGQHYTAVLRKAAYEVGQLIAPTLPIWLEEMGEVPLSHEDLVPYLE
ncbi:MAG: hypothetical protein GY696_20660 [Gammaproteobacteria bacterium]|nr:hypothetical protein [Gammaproteobacteria bacterium]